jgi:sigma-E factor negative regulatory protein RseB
MLRWVPGAGLIGGLLALSLSCSTLAADADPAGWLDRMTGSLHSHSYSGTFILQRGDRIDTVRVVHAAEDGGYRERLQTLTGSAREVIRSVDRLSALKGARAEGSGEGGVPPQWPPAIARSLLRTHLGYQLQTPGEERIAGLPCQLLHAEARDGWRYSHRYCVHAESGLPLLSELIDADGQLLERMVFTDIEFLDVVFEDALQAHGCARHIEVRATGDDAAAAAAGEAWRFESLPPGFQPVIVTQRSLGSGSAPALHYVLSDGLATVSVYVDDAAGPQEAFEGATRAGATYAVARVVDGHQLTVVGEVPMDTVRRIAESVRHEGAPVDG